MLRSLVRARPLRSKPLPRYGQWSSPFIFVLAVIGSAMGLGNIWRFPYLVGQYGGSAFVLVYLACVVAVGLPLMVAELMLGRRSRCTPIYGLLRIAREEGLSGGWSVIGWLGSVTGMLALSAYSIVGGWSMAYVFRSAAGAFHELDAVAAARLFQELTDDPERLLAWHTLFMAMTILVVGRGVRYGLEEAVRWFVPVLLTILGILVFYAHGQPSFDRAVDFLLRADFARLDATALLAALGHAFFSLSLGLGALVIYGAYAPERVSLLAVAPVVVLTDALVGLLAGLALVPVVFQAGLSVVPGPGLIFQTLPLAFGTIPGGQLMATLFFTMLVLAIWISAISMLEPAVTYVMKRWRVERSLAASLVGVLVWSLGVLSLLSFNLWSHLQPLGSWSPLGRGTFFDVLNFFVTGLLLPLTGLLTALFVGWRMSADSSRIELGGGWGYRLWLVLIRFTTPVAVVLLFLHAMGLV
ncbi:MAG: sodium-dependent transporter [Nitrococcus mobilis]|nr:sodium-dependent transporter [Nitrococcus mobilis]